MPAGFDELIHRLMSRLIFALPKNDLIYILDADVLDTRVGAVLSQLQCGI